MQILIREITTRSDGDSEFRDRDFDGDALTIGSAPDQAIQFIGRGIIGHHAILTKSSGGLSLRCRRGAKVQIGDDSNVTKAELTPGTSVEISGNRLTLIDAPGGFDAAITVELNTEVEASEFEAAFVTDLDQTWLGKRSPAWWLALGVQIRSLYGRSLKKAADDLSAAPSTVATERFEIIRRWRVSDGTLRKEKRERVIET